MDGGSTRWKSGLFAPESNISGMNPTFLPVPGTGMFINVALIHFVQFQEGKAIVDLGTNQITIEGEAVLSLRARFEPAPAAPEPTPIAVTQPEPVAEPAAPPVSEPVAAVEPENPTQPEA